MSNQLVRIVEDSGLDTTKSQFILDKFQDYFKIASEWEVKAKTIVVTSVDQTAEMQMARVGRLFLREKRIAIENARKQLKEQSLREGKAIDGIANVLKSLIVPIEEYLDKQEKFAENLRKEQERIETEKLRREEQEREEQERLAKIEAEKAERERIRIENEALKQQALEQERLAKIEREKREKERLAHEKQLAEQQRQQQLQLEQEREIALKKQREIEAKAEKERNRFEKQLNKIVCPNCGHKFDKT